MSEGTPPRDLPDEPGRVPEDPGAPVSPPQPSYPPAGTPPAEPGGWSPPPPPQPPPGEWGQQGAGAPPPPPGSPGWQGQPEQAWGQQPPGGYPPAGPPPGYQSQQGSGLAENVASGLSYVLTFVTGLIFFLTDKRPEVRFHAMQAILFGAVWFAVGVLNSIISAFLIDLLLLLVSIAFFVVWIVLMIQGFSGRHFKLPVLGDVAEQQAAKQG